MGNVCVAKKVKVGDTDGQQWDFGHQKKILEEERPDERKLKNLSQQSTSDDKLGPVWDFEAVNLVTKRNKFTQDYRVTKNVLGQGINGAVMECIKRDTEEKVALKILQDTPKAREEIEINWIAGVAENIVKIQEVYENVFDGNNPRLLVVMECMTGGTLFEKIEEHAPDGMPEMEVAKIMLEIVKAIHHLHTNNIAHRDLKPENLLYSCDGPEAVLKLGDFGFAKKMDVQFNNLTETTCACYTPYYAAPEVLEEPHKSENCDKSCDIWSLGVIMYILLCGSPPFHSVHGAQMSTGMKYRICAGQFSFAGQSWDAVSEAAKDLISHMLKTNPAERYTIEQVMEHQWIAHFTQVLEPSETPRCNSCCSLQCKANVQEKRKEHVAQYVKEQATIACRMRM